MAAQGGVKGFLVGLGAVAVAGGGALFWMSSSAGGGGPETIQPLPLSAGDFPGYILGSDTAPVEIVEFADFQCPACAQFAVLTGPDIKQRLVASGRVRWVFRDFPLDMHPNAIPAHVAAACADEQGQFWAMHDLLFFRQTDWARERRPQRKFRDYAESLGMDMGAFRECQDSQRHLARIQGTRQAGIALGVSSTPTFIIGNLRVSGTLPYDSITALVDRVAGQ